METVGGRLKRRSYTERGGVILSEGLQDRVQRLKVGDSPVVVKLLSMLDPSQESTALSTDGSVLNPL